MSQNHPRRKSLTPERLERLDLETALAFYRDRFADASDFLFTLVGNFEVDSIRPLVEKWIGGLPAAGREDHWRDVGVEAPEGVVEFTVEKGIEPKSSVSITFHGPAEWSPLNDHVLRSTAELMRIRLREVMREDMGGVYGVNVYGSIRRYPRQRYNLGVTFSCDPERVDELTAAVFAEIEALRTNPPDEAYVEKVREAQIRQHETDLENNGFWASTLEWHERNGLDLMEILNYEDLVAAVTPDSVHEAAVLYLSPDRYVKGVLYPEEMEAAEEQEAPPALEPASGQ
jgi:zinc protease